MFISIQLSEMHETGRVKTEIEGIGYHSFSTYAKFSERLTSSPLIRTRTCACQGVRNASFSENFAYVLNE